jgi:hypothetical protein
LAFNKVVITLLSLLFSAVLLSLNFMTVNSIEAPQSEKNPPERRSEQRSERRPLSPLPSPLPLIRVQKNAGHEGEIKAAVEANILEYASISPEVQPQQKSFDLVQPSRSPEEKNPNHSIPSQGQLPKAANFGFTKVQAVIEADTLVLQTSGARSPADLAADSTLDAVPEFADDFSIRQDLYLDDATLHGPGQEPREALAGVEEAPIPLIEIQYDRNGNYDARQTWANVELPDLLARAMLAEENEKLFDPDRGPDFIGAGWVMVNRTETDDFFDYADDSLYGALVPYFQFALGGVLDQTGKVLPGNAAIVANPEAYPSWFGGSPQESYWKAYQIAIGILLETIPDPTAGALYFADFYINNAGESVAFEDGRTRFWNTGYPSCSIPELERRGSAPWSTN